MNAILREKYFNEEVEPAAFVFLSNLQRFNLDSRSYMANTIYNAVYVPVEKRSGEFANIDENSRTQLLDLATLDILAKVFLAMITRVADKERTTLTVSGRIDAEQLPDLRRFVEAEQENEVTLDLAEVSLVDADAVRFLLLCEEQGIWIVRCPAYVREWMVREKRSQ